MEPIKAANELYFRVGFSGHSGHLRLQPLSTAERSDPVKSLPDFVLVSVQILASVWHFVFTQWLLALVFDRFFFRRGN